MNESNKELKFKKISNSSRTGKNEFKKSLGKFRYRLDITEYRISELFNRHAEIETQRKK